MHLIRLAYATLFLIALMAVFILWSQVGGQNHLDLMPWHLKLLLGLGAAFAAVKATESSVDNEKPWNGRTLRWAGILLALLIGCGCASYYYHTYEEDNGDDTEENVPAVHPARSLRNPHEAAALVRHRHRGVRADLRRLRGA
jgi:hypothetical protein